MRRRKTDKGYRSKFEERVAEKLEGLVDYEVDKLSFTQPEVQRNYIPDFRYREDHTLYIECKGRFTNEDRKKMLWVIQQHPDKTIRILFENASVKIRKGSKTTYGDWCDKHGIEWWDFRRGIPTKWLKSIEKNQ